MKKFLILAGLTMACSLSPQLAAVAQSVTAPTVKLLPVPETTIPLTRWETNGDGRSIPTPPGFAQEGKVPFAAEVVLPNDVDYRLTAELVFPVEGSGFAATAGVPEVPRVRNSVTSLPVSVSRSKNELYFDRKRTVPLPENANLDTFAVPLVITSLNGTVKISIGQSDTIKPVPEAGALSLSLRGGASLTNVQFTTTRTPKSLLPVSLEDEAHLRISDSVPKGMMMTGETPFLFSYGAKQALDVSASLSGWDDTKVRSVKSYLRDGLPQRGRPSPSQLGRILLNVPTKNYSAIHLLAFSREGDKSVPRMTVRLGFMGDAAGILEDQVVNVPLSNGQGEGEYVVSRSPIKMENGKTGFLHHLRVPFAKSANLSGLVNNGRPLHVELTRDMQVRVPVPDPFEFGLVPTGQPSGVVVLAATMEQTPVAMEYSTGEAGNIFHDTQKVNFQTKLTNNSEKPVSGRVLISANGPGTAQETLTPKKVWKASAEYSLQPGESKTLPLDVTPDKRGWYKATVVVEADGEVVQRRDTSFAVLAPDTRRALEDSPFGVWSFWDAHSATTDPDRAAKLGSMIEKGGWRWTYGGNPAHRKAPEEEEIKIFRFLKNENKLTFTVQSPPHSYQRGEGWWDAEKFAADVQPWLELQKKKGVDNHFKVLHESRSSTSLLRRYSDHLGGEIYDMPAEEITQLQKQYANVVKYAAALKKADPNVKIVLINDYAVVAEEYLKRGFPKELFDAIGLESANFMREPERQPDWLSMLGTMAQIRRIQQKYGYDKPVWTTEALYHGTNPGNLDYHQQGVIAVREAMIALANNVERMAAAGLIADSADDYYWSNWGGAGFAERDPEYNPKPSYAMYAWMTQVLDQAKYQQHLDTGSTALHVLDFLIPDKTHVYPVWTPRGRQSVTLQTQGGNPVVYDVYGNPLNVTAQAGRITLEASDTPLYVTGTTVTGVAQSTPVEVPREMGKVILDFDNPEQWKTVQEPSKVLAESWATPYVKGDFATSFVQEDGASTLRLELQEDKDARKLLPRYIEMALTQPIGLEGMRPAYFTVRVKGNGGWGRVMFEFTDAAGRIWTSSGNQLPGATNAADSEGESFVSFDGWHTIKMPLPGQYQSPDQFVHWPRNFDWWPTGATVDKALAEETAKAIAAGVKRMPVADGHDPVSYPIKLTKVIVSMRPHVLYVNKEVPVKDLVLYLDKLGVIDAQPGM